MVWYPRGRCNMFLDGNELMECTLGNNPWDDLIMFDWISGVFEIKIELCKLEFD